MNVVFTTNLREIVIIIALEVLLCLNSAALGYNVKKKAAKIVNYAFAVVWAVCAVMNIITLL